MQIVTYNLMYVSQLKHISEYVELLFLKYVVSIVDIKGKLKRIKYIYMNVSIYVDICLFLFKKTYWSTIPSPYYFSMIKIELFPNQQQYQKKQDFQYPLEAIKIDPPHQLLHSIVILSIDTSQSFYSNKISRKIRSNTIFYLTQCANIRKEFTKKL